ncbi:MAG TPA: GcrA family cell cycle regulator [Candidatus Paceibacterota bacterium]|nr:GcrA family cell cycle regulator [Candidatus Paceibacterota bacterium]
MGSTKNHGWTDERIELLKKLWSEGFSKSQIAAQLGGVTANAVIGKIHRLNLSGRPKPAPSQARPRKPRTGSTNNAALMRLRIKARREPPKLHPEAARQAALPRAVMEIPQPKSINVTLLQVEEGMCHTIVRDQTETSPALYCGADTGGKRNQYCLYHAHYGRQAATPVNPQYGAY